MLDPRDFASFWGLCGGLMCGATELLLAYSDRVGSPEARRAAWLRLIFGATMGPIIAEALTVHLVLKIVPALAIAGSLAAKKTVPASAGTFPTHGGLFIGLLVGVVLIMGGLTFFPSLALGPIVEHLAGSAGQTFSTGG